MLRRAQVRARSLRERAYGTPCQAMTRSGFSRNQCNSTGYRMAHKREFHDLPPLNRTPPSPNHRANRRMSTLDRRFVQPHPSHITGPTRAQASPQPSRPPPSTCGHTRAIRRTTIVRSGARPHGRIGANPRAFRRSDLTNLPPNQRDRGRLTF